MDDIKITDSNRLIPISLFSVCKKSGKTRKEITNLYPDRKDGIYYLDKFKRFLLESFQLSIEEYVEQYLGISYPRDDRGNFLGNQRRGTGLIISRYRKGGINKNNCPNFRKSCDRLSEERMGSKNPGFGKKPWNFGKTKNTDSRIKCQIGRITSEEAKKKQSIAAKNRKVCPRTGKRHSKETLEFLKEHTTKMWEDGRFNRKTSIECIVEKYLEEIGQEFQSQVKIGHFCVDIFIKEFNLVVEVQGTYFHSDPRRYPDGPINGMQRRNFARDGVKRKELSKLGFNLLELWEIDINNGDYKEILKCKLQELKR